MNKVITVLAAAITALSATPAQAEGSSSSGGELIFKLAAKETEIRDGKCWVNVRVYNPNSWWAEYPKGTSVDPGLCCFGIGFRCHRRVGNRWCQLRLGQVRRRDTGRGRDLRPDGQQLIGAGRCLPVRWQEVDNSDDYGDT